MEPYAAPLIVMIIALFFLGIRWHFKVEDQISTHCRFCNNEISMSGTLTNMYALGYGDDSIRYDKEIGVMCADHASAFTGKLLREGRVSKEQIQEANIRAMKFMARKIQQP